MAEADKAEKGISETDVTHAPSETARGDGPTREQNDGETATDGLAEVEEDSSPLTTSTSSDEDEGQSEEPGVKSVPPGDLESIAAELKAEAEGEVEDEDDGVGLSSKEPPRTKNEAKELPPVAPIDPIGEDERLVKLGVVDAVVEGIAVIRPEVPNPLHSEKGFTMPLDEGAVVATEERQPAGRIEEAFGPITNPRYAMRWPGTDQQPPEGARPGDTVHVVEGRAVARQVERTRGVDASGMDDEEIPEEFQEASDDEEEKGKRGKCKRKGTRGSTGGKAVASNAETALQQGSSPDVFSQRIGNLRVSNTTSEFARSFVDRMAINTDPSSHPASTQKGGPAAPYAALP